MNCKATVSEIWIEWSLECFIRDKRVIQIKICCDTCGNHLKHPPEAFKSVPTTHDFCRQTRKISTFLVEKEILYLMHSICLCSFQNSYGESKANILTRLDKCAVGDCILRYFYTLPHNSGWLLWFHVGRPCVRPSICFWMITWVNLNGFSPNLVCALILWRSDLGLLMGKFRQIFTVICSRHAHIFISGW